MPTTPIFSFIKRLGNTLYSVYSLTIFFLLAAIVLVFYGLISWMPERKRLLWIYRINYVWQQTWCLLTGVRITVSGSEKCDPDTAYVLVLNHSNMLDILVAGGSIIHPFKPLAKKELFRIPIMGWIFRAMCLGVDRKSVHSRTQSFQRMVGTLQKGISVMIFPEGTRNRTDQPLKSFYNGAFRLAVETQHPILPILLLNVKSLQPVDTIRLYPGRVLLKYLDPIDPQGYDLDTLKNEVFQRMYQEIQLAHSESFAQVDNSP